MLAGLIILIIAVLMIVGGFTLIKLGSNPIKENLSPKMPLVILGLFLVFFSLFPFAMSYEFYNSYGSEKYEVNFITVGG